MADSATSVLGMILMETGGDENTWGTLLNTQMIQYAEDKMVSNRSVSTTGGATTLSATQVRSNMITISGTLTTDATLTVPAATNSWFFTNATAGTSFGVFVKASGSSITVNVPVNTTKQVYCDGTNVARTDRNQIGEMFFHAGGAVPGGAVECDGSSYNRTSGIAVDLFGVIQATWGGTGATFKVPNAYDTGKFLRSRSASVTIGTAQAELVGPHSHAVTNNLTVPLGTFSAAAGAVTVYTPGVSPLGVTGTLSVNDSTGAENRPSNLSAILCIRL